MTCPKIESLKQLLLEHSPRLQSKRWTKHIRQCSHCHKEHSLMQRVLASYQALEREILIQAPKLSWQNFSRTLQHELDMQRNKKRRRWMVTGVAGGVAASLLIGVLLTNTWIKNLAGHAVAQPTKPVLQEGLPSRVAAGHAVAQPTKPVLKTQVLPGNIQPSSPAWASKATTPNINQPANLARTNAPAARKNPSLAPKELATRPLSREETLRFVRLLQQHTPAPLPVPTHPRQQTPVSTR